MSGNNVKMFVGMDELLRMMQSISIQVRNLPVCNEMNMAVSELFLLQKGLERLKSDRDWVDAADVDGFIDRLIHGLKAG